ncbi:ABC transporter permease [Acidiferrobacter sp.]|uniref:ABC transporter permease n=1 Tax=Acidiferrobacter sp. TaxID=1872107 RepID=UPI00345B8D61
MTGFFTLLYKELLRFSKVFFQTIFAPVVTALLYLLVFASAFKARPDILPGVPFVAFLVPGLMMMSMIQNAFANSSSSLIQSKIAGNLIFILLSPLSAGEFFLAFVAASVVRALCVAVGIYVAAVFFVALPVHHPLYLALFAILGSAALGALGVIAGVWAERFDQLAGFQNFVVVPLSFLSGVFYSLRDLPPFWRMMSRFNPLLYMIDGFRYGFFGQSDVSPPLSLAIVAAFCALVSGLAMALVGRGYRLRN